MYCCCALVLIFLYPNLVSELSVSIKRLKQKLNMHNCIYVKIVVLLCHLNVILLFVTKRNYYCKSFPIFFTLDHFKIKLKDASDRPPWCTGSVNLPICPVFIVPTET